MKIDIESINHNAVMMIKNLVESRYDIIDEDKQNIEKDCFLMTIGEIAGIIKMADAMKEVLKA